MKRSVWMVVPALALAAAVTALSTPAAAQMPPPFFLLPGPGLPLPLPPPVVQDRGYYYRSAPVERTYQEYEDVEPYCVIKRRLVRTEYGYVKRRVRVCYN